MLKFLNFARPSLNEKKDLCRVATMRTVWHSYSESGDHMFYALRLSPDQDLRSFHSEQNARMCGRGYSVFSNSDDLAATNLTHEELMEIYWRLTGYETRIMDRVYLCDLIWDGILKLDISPSDPEPVKDEEPDAGAWVVDQISDDLNKAKDDELEPKGLSNEEESTNPDPAPAIDLEVNEETPQMSLGYKLLRNREYCGEIEEDEAEAAIPLTYKLKPPQYYKYTEREKAIFKFISRRHPRKVTMEEISGLFKELKASYVQSRTILHSLRKKMALNNEPIDILRSKNEDGRGFVHGIAEREIK